MAEYECEHCFQVFTRKINLKLHMQNRPPQCLRVEQKTLEKKNKEIQDALEKKEAELRQRFDVQMKQIDRNYADNIKNLQETNDKVVEQLVHSKPTIRDRKKIVENNNAQLIKIPNFETVILNTEFPLKTIRKCLKAGIGGDIYIFKKCYLEKIPKEQRCIVPTDTARDKYKYFDGKEWCTSSLLYLIEEVIARQLHSIYQPVIKEKLATLEKIDKEYPPWEDSEKNMIEYDKVVDQYSDETTHNGQLLYLPDDFKHDLRDQLRDLIIAYNR